MIEKDCKTLLYSNLSGKAGYHLLMLFFILSILLFGLFISLGLYCFLGYDRIEAILESINASQVDWDREFGNDKTFH